MILPPPKDMTSFPFRKWLESLVLIINSLISGGGGVSDHGALTGLTDDDHSQYHNDTRGDARYYTQAQVDTALSGKSNTGHTHLSSDVINFDEAVDDRVANLLTAGTNITLTYNDAGNTLTINASGGGSGLTYPQVLSVTAWGL
jgi:YD repeat-containing protein